MFTPPFILSIAGGGSTYTPGIVKSLMVRLQDFPLAEIRLYDKLFSTEYPGEATGNYLDDINPESLVVLKHCKLEPALKDAKPGQYLQFMRTGYFVADSVDHTSENPVFNRTVTLKDSWSKKAKKQK